MQYITDDNFTKKLPLYMVFFPWSPLFVLIIISHKWQKRNLSGHKWYGIKAMILAIITATITSVCLSPLMKLVINMEMPLIYQIFAFYLYTVCIALSIREVDYWNCKRTAKQIAGK